MKKPRKLLLIPRGPDPGTVVRGSPRFGASKVVVHASGGDLFMITQSEPQWSTNDLANRDLSARRIVRIRINIGSEELHTQTDPGYMMDVG